MLNQPSNNIINDACILIFASSRNTLTVTTTFYIGIENNHRMFAKLQICPPNTLNVPLTIVQPPVWMSRKYSKNVSEKIWIQVKEKIRISKTYLIFETWNTRNWRKITHLALESLDFLNIQENNRVFNCLIFPFQFSLKPNRKLQHVKNRLTDEWQL